MPVCRSIVSHLAEPFMKSIYRKIFTLFLALSLIAALFSFFPENAEADTDENFYFYRAALAEMPNGAALQSAYDSFLDAVQKLPEALAQGKTESVTGDIYSLGLNTSEITAVRNAVVGDHPECFWYTGSTSVTSYGNIIRTVITRSSFSADVLPGSITAFNNRVNSILSGASGLSSDYEKAKYFHDSICLSATYVTAASYNQSAYSALVLGETVCAGYAKAFQLLCQRSGIQCLYVGGHANNSQDANHAWTIVRLGGNYYQTDVTWDDWIDNNTDVSEINYDYFNLTDSAMNENHTVISYSNASYAFYQYLPACNSTELNYYIKNVNDGRMLRVASGQSGSLTAADLLFALQNPIDDICRIYVENPSEVGAVSNALYSNAGEILNALGLYKTSYYYSCSFGKHVLTAQLFTSDAGSIHGNLPASVTSAYDISIVDSLGNILYTKSISGIGASYTAYNIPEGTYTVIARKQGEILCETETEISEGAEFVTVECDIYPDTDHVHVHVWSEGEIITEAGPGIKGETCYKCLKCGDERTEYTPALAVSGSCGANAVWSYEDGVLTVSGTGSIRSYTRTTMPWYELLADIEEIVIGDGITSIGNYAFAGCENAESLTLGAAVSSIGINAFSGCSALESVSLPASLTSIANYAFNNCASLSLIEFNSASAPALAANALANTRLTAIYKASWTDFNKEKYGGKTVWLVDHTAGKCGATSYSLDRGVMTISGNGSIRGYSKGEAPWYAYRDEIVELIIGGGVTSVGNYAFYGCGNLSDMTLGSGVTAIGTSAFYGCTSLTEVTFPASLTTLGAYAFSNCSGITDLVFTGQTAPASVSPTALNTVKAKALYPDTQSWGEFTKTGYGGAIYWTNDPDEEITGGACGNQAAWILIDGTLTIYGQKGTKSYSSKTQVPWYEYREEITAIVVEDGITSIGNYSFMECANATSVYLGNTLTFIGVNAFSTCRGLTAVTIPETVTKLNAYAFNKCSGLTEVIITRPIDQFEVFASTAFANTSIKITE